jgi:hypothetical protein
MFIERCPRDGTPLSEVETKNLFTRHGGCTKCGSLYVMWGNAVTPCRHPTVCAGRWWFSRYPLPFREPPIIPGPQYAGTV